MDTDHFQQLCVRFATLTKELKASRAGENGCYIDVLPCAAPGALFLVQREAPDREGQAAVVLTATPERDTATSGIVFRVHVLSVVDKMVEQHADAFLPVQFDPGGREFRVNMVGPIAEPELALFFLSWAKGVLSSVWSERRERARLARSRKPARPATEPSELGN